MKSQLLTITSILLIIVGCNPKEDNHNQTIYFNGDIITMEGEEPQYVESVVQQDGKIIFLGPKSEALKSYKNATLVDLEGKTLLPAFLDGHGHFYSVGLTASMEMSSPLLMVLVLISILL